MHNGELTLEQAAVIDAAVASSSSAPAAYVDAI
jgi:hypothetical protein